MSDYFIYLTFGVCFVTFNEKRVSLRISKTHNKIIYVLGYFNERQIYGFIQNLAAKNKETNKLKLL
jgi:hypothetical protein